VIPVVGATKNVVEIFTGDLIPDKDGAEPPQPLDAMTVQQQPSTEADLG
jgi:hypothetical protein